MPGKPDVFKSLRIIHTAMLTGTFAFTFTVFFGNRHMAIDKWDESFQKIFLLVLLFLSASCLLTGLTLYKKKVAELRNSQEPILSKMDKYKAASIRLWAMIEGPALLSAIGIMMSGNYICVGISVMLLILLFLFAPRKESIISQLNLETDEVAQLDADDKMKG